MSFIIVPDEQSLQMHKQVNQLANELAMRLARVKETITREVLMEFGLPLDPDVLKVSCDFEYLRLEIMAEVEKRFKPYFEKATGFMCCSDVSICFYRGSL